MKLKNKKKHMNGKAVRVNGFRYEIDSDGVVHDVKKEDAEKLLKGKDWTVEKSESGLLTDDGEPADDDPPVDDKDQPVADDDPPDADDEIAEPDESMGIDALKAMADEIGISYGPNIGKSLLVERIKEAMKG